MVIKHIISLAAIAMISINAAASAPPNIEDIKTSMNAVTGIATSKLGTGASLGQINGNYVECDSDGNCIDTGTLSLNAGQLGGQL
ncbi:hypothetical protein, partial [Pseudoalteromonas marina]